MNIVTVQLQDYYQHKVFETVISNRHWSRFESRLKRNVDVTMSLLEHNNVKATFFTLGWIAERFPELIIDIRNEGHELGSAGFWGVDRNKVSQADFREDMRLGKDALEYVTGARVNGFRTVRRSFSEKDLWMIDLVAEEGFKYDSSLMPIGIGNGFRKKTKYPFSHETRRGEIFELPHSSTNFLGASIPIGGGNFLRQFPSSLMFNAFEKWVRENEHPFMLYFHPWELDESIPEVSAFDSLTHARQYRNLGKLKELLPKYFDAAPFGTAHDYLNLDYESVEKIEKEQAENTKIEIGSQRYKEISIVIPCFNEEAALGFLKKAIVELIDAASDKYNPHFIFVDDKSTDDTVKLLNEFFCDEKFYTIVEHEENKGVSGAIQTGIAAAKTEIVCSMDADCSYDPLELLKMIPMLDSDTVLITASPYHKNGDVLGVPRWRLFLSRGLSGIYRFVLKHKFATYTSCFRVYNKSRIQRFIPKYGDFRGIVEFLAKVDFGGEGIKEFPTVLQCRIFGFSKMKTLKTIKSHIKLLAEMRKFKKEVN